MTTPRCIGFLVDRIKLFVKTRSVTPYIYRLCPAIIYKISCTILAQSYRSDKLIVNGDFHDCRTAVVKYYIGTLGIGTSDGCCNTQIHLTNYYCYYSMVIIYYYYRINRQVKMYIRIYCKIVNDD